MQQRHLALSVCFLLNGCAYNVTPDQHQAKATMTTDRAVQVVTESLKGDAEEGLGICALAGGIFGYDTRTPRFQSADAQQFTYLDNKGGGNCTNDCPDPDHQFVIRYENIKRIFISKTTTPSLCRHEPGYAVIQIVAKHENRNLTMATVRAERLPEVLAAYQHLNPKIALKNAY